MKRLREQPSSPDPLIARAAFLLSAVPPLDTAPIPRRPLPANAKARTKALQMRVAMALAVSFASAVAGAATLHRTGWLRSFTATEATAPRPSLPPPSTTSPIAPTPPAVRSAPSAAPSAAPVPSPIAIATDARPSVTGLPATRATASTNHAAPAADSRGSSPLADESALVVDAVRALRRDRDPRRAGKLAQEALQRYPQGAQVEEATAIAMEAAFAEGDAAGARAWAERYVSTFAAGRFADRAKQLLVAAPR